MRPTRIIALLALTVTALPALADERSDALFAKAQETLKKAKSLSMDRTVSIQLEGKSAGQETQHLKLLKPGYWLVTRDRDDPRRRVGDGKYVYSSWDKKKQYIKVDALKPELLFQDLGPVVGAFFGTGVILPSQSGKYLGKQDVDGKTYEAVEVLGETPGGIPAVQKLFFGPSGLPEIREFRSEMEKGKEMVMREKLSKIDLKTPLTPGQFKFTLPKGYTILNASARK